MSFQQSSFQQDAFQIDVPAGGAATAPQRLYLWKAAAVVALGFFSQDDYATAKTVNLTPFRSVAASSGMAARGYSQLVLVDGEQDARRTNHSQRLLFGRSAAAQIGQPWYRWATQKRIDAEEELPRSKPSQLHQYRVGYQTVGQSFSLWPGAQKRIDEVEYALPKPVDLTPYRSQTVVVTAPGAPWYLWPRTPQRVEPEEDARRGNQNLLHLYRVGYQTVGQPFSTWPGAQKRIDEESFSVSKPVDLTPFRNSSTATAQPGQPWHLWKPQVRHTPDEQYLVIGQGTFSSPQAITPPVQPGQPWFMWKPQVRHTDPEEYIVPASSNFALSRLTIQTILGTPTYFYVPYPPYPVEEDGGYRVNHGNRLFYGRQATTVVAGQPWYLWQPPITRIEPEEDARRVDQTSLHRFRTGFQTVGQSFAYWIKPQARIDEEGYTVPGPANLYPYRQVTVTVQPGQPWFMWPSAKADQTVEPNPVVTDHAQALNPFRPHQAITPPVIDSGVTPGWPIYGGRRIRKPRLEQIEPVRIEQVQEELANARTRLEQRKEQRRLEKRDRYVTDEIRRLLDEQDRLKLSVETLKLQLKMAGMQDDDILLILALAS